jgi:hypothetical protein
MGTLFLSPLLILSKISMIAPQAAQSQSLETCVAELVRLKVAPDIAAQRCASTHNSSDRSAQQPVVPPIGQDTCAAASMRRFGSVSSDCQKVRTEGQDICAAVSMQRYGSVSSDCLKVTQGGLCAAVSMERSGRVSSDCEKIRTVRQDTCAAASMRRYGSVSSDCLKVD